MVAKLPTKMSVPEKSVELDLSNKSMDDIEFLRRQEHLEKLDFSINRVISLEPLEKCVRLRELRFRFNLVGI